VATIPSRRQARRAGRVVEPRNLLTCAEQDLLAAKALLTVGGGQVVSDGREQ
jgi:hypothetical protein